MFDSAIQAVTRRFARELWQVTPPLLAAVPTLPFWAAPIVEFP
ncbi:hypothetical protein [Mesorhizobium ventifaucium]|nr:hypothetical protein [Mesorhizobium ventifaucium]